MSTAMAWKETDLNTVEKRSKYTVSVVGCGRKGLFSSCLFANAGFKVIGVDSDLYIANLIKKGRVLSGEPKLAQLIKEHVKNGRISATNQAKEAVQISDVVVLAVPPTLDHKRKPDYAQVENACKEVGMGLRSGSLVNVESSMGPGVTETSVKEILEKSSGLRAGTDFGLAYAPLNTLPQHSFEEVIIRPRIVGALNEQSLKAASLVLKQISTAEIIRVSSIKTAEAATVFESVYRETNYALANELALFCERAGIDFFEVQKTLYTQPSCCMPVPDILGCFFVTDPHLLFEEAENVNVQLHLAEMARKINSEMLNHTLRLIRDALKTCGKPLRRARVSVFGISNHTDASGEAGRSFVKHLITALSRSGARVSVYDPFFSHKQLLELDFPAKKTLRESVEGADCLIFTVGGERFKRLSLKRIKFSVRKPAAIVDLAHAFNPDEARKEGLTYRGLGRR